MTKTFSLLSPALARALTRAIPTRRAFVSLGLCAFTTLLPAISPAQSWGSEGVLGALDMGAPPIIGREAMVLQVLPETGACSVHPMAPAIPCPRVQLPDGSVQDVRIDGFNRAGPLTIDVDRLIYDWALQTGSHPYTPAFAYTGETDFEAWTREQWGPCEHNRCAMPEPQPLHPAYAIAMPDVVERAFIDVELLSDQGVCLFLALPEDQTFPCHEVRLPGGEVIALDIGPHARSAIGTMLYMQRVTYASPHPLLDHDRYDFIPYQRPTQ